jgi:hypothetical protein
MKKGEIVRPYSTHERFLKWIFILVGKPEVQRSLGYILEDNIEKDSKKKRGLGCRRHSCGFRIGTTAGVTHFIA